MTYVINPSLFSVAATNLLLDETGLGSAHAAYSVARKLRAAYSGSAIRVRRTSDSTEQDIGFSGNELDTSSLETFCSGTNGYVVTLYDQSGNGNNATQATTSKQMQIVSSGSTLTDNGKPAMLAANTTAYFYSGGSISSHAIVTMYTVTNATATAGDNNIKVTISYGDVSGASNRAILRYGTFNNSGDENKPTLLCTSSATAAQSSAANTAQVLMIGVVNGTALSLYENNNSEVSSTQTAPSIANDEVMVGAVGFETNTLKGGNWQEGVVWESDIEAYVSTIKSNVNGFYSIY